MSNTLRFQQHRVEGSRHTRRNNTTSAVATAEHPHHGRGTEFVFRRIYIIIESAVFREDAEMAGGALDDLLAYVLHVAMDEEYGVVDDDVTDTPCDGASDDRDRSLSSS
ncbi:hypothetical protein FRB96_000692 [Tulasnella sp. 330]|nr:hypothetical protein FRB96_000692 [Tulasnella sp. 330]